MTEVTYFEFYTDEMGDESIQSELYSYMFGFLKALSLTNHIVNQIEIQVCNDSIYSCNRIDNSTSTSEEYIYDEDNETYTLNKDYVYDEVSEYNASISIKHSKEATSMVNVMINEARFFIKKYQD